ncbi:hypothetical protein 1 [Beihai shrimp virus 4]|uniref:hypothetical protein 1 n=1 Tax=Beihai shrimp virus 4 TaxID=1922670 RepID=UPI00090C4467|nr:hypothetical protein 1 [Beihai shrimp virus 4]APG75682.1 hypothetical protein 1 [Beihai shrimp virus 4]
MKTDFANWTWISSQLANIIHPQCDLPKPADLIQIAILIAVILWACAKTDLASLLVSLLKSSWNRFVEAQSDLIRWIQKLAPTLLLMTNILIEGVPNFWYITIAAQIILLVVGFGVVSVMPQAKLIPMLELQAVLPTSPFMDDKSKVPVVAVANANGDGSHIVGQAVRIGTLKGKAAFATVAHVAKALTGTPYLVNLDENVAVKVLEVVICVGVPDAALLLCDPKKVSQLGGIAKTAQISCGAKPAVLHSHGLKISTLSSLKACSKANVENNGNCTFVYYGSALPGFSGGPVSVLGRVVGIHTGATGATSSGYLIDGLLAWMRRFEARAGRVVMEEHSPGAWMQKLLDRDEDVDQYYDFEEFVEPNHDRFLRVSDRKTGKVYLYDEDDVDDELYKLALKRAGNTRTRTEFELNSFKKHAPTPDEPVNYDYVLRGQQAMARYSAVVATLSRSIMALQTVLGQVRKEPSQTAQVGVDVNAFNEFAHRMSNVGVAMSQRLVEICRLGVTDVVDKNRAERWRARHPSPPVSTETREELRRMELALEEAYNAMEQIPVRGDDDFEQHTSIFCNSLQARYGVKLGTEFHGDSFLEERFASTSMTESTKMSTQPTPKEESASRSQTSFSKLSPYPNLTDGHQSEEKPFQLPSPITKTDAELRRNALENPTKESLEQSKQQCKEAMRNLELASPVPQETGQKDTLTSSPQIYQQHRVELSDHNGVPVKNIKINMLDRNSNPNKNRPFQCATCKTPLDAGKVLKHRCPKIGTGQSTM